MATLDAPKVLLLTNKTKLTLTIALTLTDTVMVIFFSPFFLYIPTKNPLFNDKVWTYYRLLVSKRVKSQKTEKIRPTHKPRYRASAKISFIIAIQPFHWCRQNAHKNITITVSVRVSAMVRVSFVLLFCITVSVRVSAMVWVSLVWLVISNNVGSIKCRHLPNIAGTIVVYILSVKQMWTLRCFACVRSYSFGVTTSWENAEMSGILSV